MAKKTMNEYRDTIGRAFIGMLQGKSLDEATTLINALYCTFCETIVAGDSGKALRPEQYYQVALDGLKSMIAQKFAGNAEAKKTMERDEIVSDFSLGFFNKLQESSVTIQEAFSIFEDMFAAILCSMAKGNGLDIMEIYECVSADTRRLVERMAERLKNKETTNAN